MAKVSADDLGTQSIGSLLIKQAVPASIGILVMSLNIIVDTIFVGNWIGSIAIAAINVVLPVSFFIAALGMAIGIGGSSIISRALGAGDKEKALKSFGNQLSLTLLLTTILVVIGLAFVEQIIPRFGGKGGIYEPAKTYYTIVLYGVPFLALCMMGNNVIRAEGKPKFAMIAMIIPSVGNLILDYILIYVFDFGMAGAAWATTISYLLCFGYILWFFLSKNSELHINLSHFNLSKKITSEIASLGSVTLARQAVVSVIYLFMNNILFNLGGESSVAVFGIIARIMMFALFPVLGITQGFLPIAGYNYGARNFSRVKETINTSIIYASGLAVVIFIFLMVFTESIVSVFTKDQIVINQTVYAMKWVFLAVPIVSIQLIGSAYFQAIGKAVPALLLTLSRQGFFFLPLVLILPFFYGEFGVWISFALADFLSTILTAYFINREVRLKLNVDS
ncbi:MATE family efflux transporter [Paucihalobacter sp.]|uniref:MATE family efflux transporter n=1 Tax=Paucihalobacter sp. TaxID=2850405 RepID=UPI002FE2B193